MREEVRLQDLPCREAVATFRNAVIDALLTGGSEVRALLEDRARSDLNVRKVYAGRFVFELLQNACDAHDRQQVLHEQGRASAPKPARAHVLLTPTHLLVANTGWPFSFEPLDQDEPSGIESICRYGASTKSSQRFKGQFGIGFKSVDEVADEVFITSGGYRLRFSRDRLRRALGDQAPRHLPLLYAPEWFEDEDAPEGIADLAQHFDTVVALRLRSRDVDAVRRRIAEIGPIEVLLLETLTHLVLEDRTCGGTHTEFTLKKVSDEPEIWSVAPAAPDSGAGVGRTGNNEVPALACDEGIPSQTTSTGMRFVVFRRPIGEGPQDHRLVWALEDNDNIVPTAGGDRWFHTFYPVTREYSGTPFIAHSYFQLDPSRKGFAGEAEDIERNEALFDGLLDLLEGTVESLAQIPRGDRPLHELVWPDERGNSATGQAREFRDRLRRRAWQWPIFEGRDAVLRTGCSYKWPRPGSGLDTILERVPRGWTPFPRCSDMVVPRPDDAPGLGTEDLGRWLVEHPPSLPDPGSFALLLDALALLVPSTDRATFRSIARTAVVLPVQSSSEESMRLVGMDERTSVFLTQERRIAIPASLDGILRAYVLHPDALGKDPATGAAQAQDFFDVRQLQPPDLIRSLMEGIEASGDLSNEQALGALELAVGVLRDEFGGILTNNTAVLPTPWFWDDKWWDPRAPWRTRMRLAKLPIPLAGRRPVPAEDLVVEVTPGSLSKFYPSDVAPEFLNESSEHPAAKAVLDRLLDSGEHSGWSTRCAVYAWLGAWPLPRLHAVYYEHRRAAASSSPHPDVSDEDWIGYLREEGERTWLDGVSVWRSVSWPHLARIAEHCAEAGLLHELLDLIANHAPYLLQHSERVAVIRTGSSGKPKYMPTYLHWQLRTTAWLPTIRLGEPAIPTRPDRAWWTAHRLDHRRLRDARWNHLPFAHAGACERRMADWLRIPVYEVAHTPARDSSVLRTVSALGELVMQVRDDGMDGAGLRRLYRELSTRLADLNPTSEELKGLTNVLVVSGTGAATFWPAVEAVLDDLPTPLPLGEGHLPRALFGPRTVALARTLGMRLMSELKIEYVAEDRDEDLPEEPTLTSWLQWLRPYVFALRAFSHLVPEAQRIDITVADTLTLMRRFTLAVVEVVDGVGLKVDGQIIARQDKRDPVVLAHQPDDRETIVVFVRKALAERCHHDAAKLLPYLAAPAATLAGAPALAHTLELLILSTGTPHDVQAETFLRDRCGVSQYDLERVREACGVESAAREIAAQEAATARRREEWRARAVALSRLVFARLLVSGNRLDLREVRVRLDAHRDDGDPLAAARESFHSIGVAADDPLWKVTSLEEAEAFLRTNPELKAAIDKVLSEAEATAEFVHAQEAALAKARIHALALVMHEAPDARVGELLASWDEVVEGIDLEAPEAVRRALRSFMSSLGVSQEVLTAVLEPPEGRFWSGAHLDFLGLQAEDVTEVFVEIEQYAQLQQSTVERREKAYQAWVRRSGLHRKVGRISVRLESANRASAVRQNDAGPVQELSMERRAGAARHHRRHQRNTLTGGLGEVFVVLQELEAWKALGEDERSRLLDEVVAEYAADPAAAEAADYVRKGPVGSDLWEEALGRLLRIGDYVGARCDVLGLASGPTLRYLEVKSTRRKQLDAFYLTAPEWSFLSDGRVKDRCAIICVSGAAPGQEPVVEVLENPAHLVEAGLLHFAPSAHEVRLHRA